MSYVTDLHSRLRGAHRMKYTNAASYGVAMKIGMRFIEAYDDPVNTRTRVYRITRAEWKELKAKEQRLASLAGEVQA